MKASIWLFDCTVFFNLTFILSQSYDRKSRSLFYSHKIGYCQRQDPSRLPQPELATDRLAISNLQISIFCPPEIYVVQADRSNGGLKRQAVDFNFTIKKGVARSNGGLECLQIPSRTDSYMWQANSFVAATFVVQNV